ncbi:MAG: GH36-type glycosyl hydrolase domain-containing protein, partial [Gemmatimonadales bacterium]
EWTLGVLREHTQHQIRTWYDAERGAIFARNPFDSSFARHVAFSALLSTPDSYTADRRAFLGRNGSLADPAALHRAALAEATGAGLDPCAALQTAVRLAPGETREITVLLGAAPSENEARELIERYRGAGVAGEAVQEARDEWTRRLSVIKVRTPDPAFDALVNQWSLYQALSCRYWARSAIYQSSGAYGFRDQLQDVMALVYAEPGLAREHILRAAGRQFVEGDVQHWWHPHSGRGVRTRFSDDLVWLPFAVEHYVTATGDTAVLEESAPYLAMRELGPDEHEVYDLPAYSGEQGTIYDHCLRAFRRAMTHGPHDLPLIGGGDWNDGMNRVGIEGRGESVWLGWFLIGTARRFATLCEAEGDGANANLLRREADRYAAAAQASAWDGEWYKRAWFDDGQPLGSHENEECRIDAIAQNWSVISGGAPEDRARKAMDSLYEHLVRPDLRLIALLTPPFDETPMDPGYIKGYLPGVRENGAQYTHAALWAVLAETMLGRGDRAWEMFQMLNPLTHSDTPEGVERYKVEPYVVASDVYTAEDHEGRGGWTWYTGSAAWTYRVALEGILGFSKVGDTLNLDPCIPSSWPEFGLDYVFGTSTYRITIRNPDGISQGVGAVKVDGEARDDQLIPLVDDGAEHEVLVTLKASHHQSRLDAAPPPDTGSGASTAR